MGMIPLQELLERYKNMMNTELILGILSLVGTIILGLLQFRHWKAQGKEAEAKAEATLGEIALKINKQEIDTLRQLRDDLKLENSQLRADKIYLEDKVAEYKKRLEDCIDGVV